MEGKFGGMDLRWRVTQGAEEEQARVFIYRNIARVCAKHQFVMQDFCSRFSYLFSYLLEKVV
jgi:hypothetical protein